MSGIPTSTITADGPSVPVAEPPLARRAHLEALTGMRIAAAFLVYLSHLSDIAIPKGSPAWFTNLMRTGYSGVTLFFVLSGFVLCLNYADRLSRPALRPLANYVVARLARVYPLYIVVLVWIVVRTKLTGAAVPWGDVGPQVFAVQAWSADLGKIFQYNDVGWSVSVEIFLYACLPVILLVLGRVRSVRILGLVGAVVIAAMVALVAWFQHTGRGQLPWTDGGSAHRWLYLHPLPRLGDFLLGVLAARIYVAVRGQARAITAGWIITAVGVVALIALMCWTKNVFSVWSYDVSCALPAVLIILGLALAPRTPVARFFALPMVVLLGEASYAFYLLHKQILALLPAGRWGTLGFTPTTIVNELANFGIVLCVAVGAHILLERPARRWIRAAAGYPWRTVAVRRLRRGKLPAAA